MRGGAYPKVEEGPSVVHCERILYRSSTVLEGVCVLLGVGVRGPGESEAGGNEDDAGVSNTDGGGAGNESGRALGWCVAE